MVRCSAKFTRCAVVCFVTFNETPLVMVQHDGRKTITWHKLPGTLCPAPEKPSPAFARDLSLDLAAVDGAPMFAMFAAHSPYFVATRQDALEEGTTVWKRILHVILPRLLTGVRPMCYSHQCCCA